jgi:hypothetical protein
MSRLRKFSVYERLLILHILPPLLITRMWLLVLVLDRRTVLRQPWTGHFRGVKAGLYPGISLSFSCLSVMLWTVKRWWRYIADRWNTVSDPQSFARRYFVGLKAACSFISAWYVQSLRGVDDSRITFILLAGPRLPPMNNPDVRVALCLGVEALTAIVLTAGELLFSIQLLEGLD